MKNTFRFLLLVYFTCCELSADAQHYVRTKKNIGVFASYYMPDFSLGKGDHTGTTSGSGFGIGITHEIKGCLFPELFFVSHTGNAFIPDNSSTYHTTGISSRALGAGLLFKYNLFPINQHKKKGYCFERMINFILGPEYTYPLGMNAPAGFKQNGEFAVKAGLGMFSVWGGSSKSHLSWVIHWELYYRQGLTPYLRSDLPLANEKYTLSSVGLTLRIMYFRTYKFSDM
jgi:hypothetical protein